jgi:hypothetical protein
MADDSTDSAFGLILFILFLALLGYAAGGVASSPSTAGSTSGTNRSLPSLEGSEVSSCPAGTLKQDEWDSSTSQNLNLKVYVDPMDPGRKCATASTTSAGTLTVTLAYAADKTQSVSGTDSCGSSGQLCTASVQVDGTDNLCISAVAELTGTTAATVTIPRVVEPCSMTVPAGQPESPIPARSDNREDEEGY